MMHQYGIQHKTMNAQECTIEYVQIHNAVGHTLIRMAKQHLVLLIINPLIKKGVNHSLFYLNEELKILHMKNLKYSIIIIINMLILFMGCKEKKDSSCIFVGFPDPIILQGTPIENIVAYSINDIKVIDTFMIINKLDKNENIIQVYSTLSKKLLWEGGNKGKGSDEDFLNSSIVLESYSNNYDNDVLFNIWDAGRQRITEINITESIRKSAFDGKGEALFDSAGIIRDVFYIDDSLLIYEPEFWRFKIKNRKTNELISISYNTSGLDFSIPKRNEYFIFTSRLTVNPSKKKIAAAPYFLGQIDFFDMNGSYSFSSVFERAENLQQALQSENVTIADAKRYIYRLHSDQNFIYALNGNLHNSTIVNNKKRPDSEMLIFDWEGQPVKKLLFNRRIASFAFDLRQKKMYAFDSNEEHFNIIEFDLSGLEFLKF